MAFKDMNENKELDNQMLTKFMSEEINDHDWLYKYLKNWYYLFQEKLKKGEIKEGLETEQIPSNNPEFVVNVDLESGLVNIRKYVLDGDYLIIRDITSKEVYSNQKFTLFDFVTLCRIATNDEEIRLNKLVSREFCYDGEKVVEKDPIYYGENFINIDNLEEGNGIRKVLTK